MILPLLLVLAAPAQGQPPAPNPNAPAPATIVAEPVAMMIAAFDADGDARVSRAELQAGVERSFRSAAKDQPSIGYLAFADWAAQWLGDRSALPSPFEVDRDSDNRITVAELQQRFAMIFARLDGNKDGVLTRAELLTIRSGRVGGAEAPGGRRTGRRGPAPEGN